MSLSTISREYQRTLEIFNIPRYWALTYIFYKDLNGRETVLDYLYELKNDNNKDSRIKLNKINDYLELLSKHGLKIGEPYIKHLEGDLWELRLLRDRIIFVTREENTLVLLHQFMKSARKTSRREIEKARREIEILRKRGTLDE